MKKISLFLAMLVLTTAAISQTCPISYKRNNGFGTSCTALITLVFPSTADCLEASTFQILHVYQDGVELGVTFTLLEVDCTASQPKISYCGSGGNIPPSGLLTFSFQMPGGTIFPCVVPGGGPLPVTLSSFYARRNNNNVSLSWKTETEINSKEFVLERRTGNSFTTVATIAAANKLNGSAYSYSDNNLNRGVSQYRLKIVDLDGSFTYSSVSAVKGTSSVSDFTVFPNPSNGSAKVTISDISESTEIQLVDLSGRVLKKVIISNSNTVELNSLKKGMYMIRIVNKNSGESTTQKLSVVN